MVLKEFQRADLIPLAAYLLVLGEAEIWVSVTPPREVLADFECQVVSSAVEISPYGSGRYLPERSYFAYSGAMYTLQSAFRKARPSAMPRQMLRLVGQSNFDLFEPVRKLPSFTAARHAKVKKNFSIKARRDRGNTKNRQRAFKLVPNQNPTRELKIIKSEVSILTDISAQKHLLTDSQDKLDFQALWVEDRYFFSHESEEFKRDAKAYYKGSEKFKWDVEAYTKEHMDELVSSWLTIKTVLLLHSTDDGSPLLRRLSPPLCLTPSSLGDSPVRQSLPHALAPQSSHPLTVRPHFIDSAVSAATLRDSGTQRLCFTESLELQGD
nr:hypothetical protein Iba_chr06aCG18260 [Ipomoea batatas]